MIRDRLQQSLWAAILAFAMTLGSLGCMVSGLGLIQPRELWLLAVWCAAWAVLLAAAMNFRAAVLLIPVALAVMAWRWFYGPLADSVERLIFEVSSIYHSGYQWPVVYWSEVPPVQSLLPALRAVAFLLELGVCWTVCRRGTAWGPVPLSALPLASSLLLTDTVPRAGYLFLYLFGLLLLLLTQGVRRRDARQANALSRKAAVVLAVALGLIFWLNPQKGYDKQVLADKLEQSVTRLVERFTAPKELEPPDSTGEKVHLPVMGDTGDMVNLENTGPKADQAQWVMTVESSKGGPLYLRGASFASYSGQTWRGGDQAQSSLEWPQFGPDAPKATLTIHARNVHSVLYLPYYSNRLPDIADGRLENRDDLSGYRVSFWELDPAHIAVSAGDAVAAQYLQLPDRTKAWAQGVTVSILGSSAAPREPEQMYAAAEKIGNYVRTSASYSLKTPRMPDGEEDFVRWFLEESETGYCVHFASSAVVLLRAAGIPSRYVTGYVVMAKEGEQTDVYLSNAHAWVEYYIPGLGWMVLEATPGSQEAPEDPYQNPETTPPVQSQPQATEPDMPVDPEQSAPQDTSSGALDTPQETTENPQQGQHKRGAGRPWLKYLLLPLGLVALVVGQWQLRLQMRRKRLASGQGNRYALMCWQEIEGMAKLLGQPPPSQLRKLAQKAKFSQHTLTQQELGDMRAFIGQAEAQLRRHPWYKQVLYRLVYALY